MSSKRPVIEVQHLKKYYGETKAVDDVSFDVRKGEIFGFLGPNGAGKTTTIRCMMDFLRPDSGAVSILGKDSYRDSSFLKKRVAYLSGDVGLYDHWNGQEHIDFVKNVRCDKDGIDELISALSFDPRKKVKNLSFGNKQKLGLILALMVDAKVLIFDEPTIGLDPLLQNAVYDMLENRAKKGCTIFMSSHNLAEVERVCDRVGIIKEGKIVSIEDVKDLQTKRIYVVFVYFDKVVPVKELVTNGIALQKELADGYALTVKGEIKPFLKKLASMPVRDVEIRHESLENIFLEFYR